MIFVPSKNAAARPGNENARPPRWEAGQNTEAKHADVTRVEPGRNSAAPAIRALLIGSNTCTAADLTVHGDSQLAAALDIIAGERVP